MKFLDIQTAASAAVVLMAMPAAAKSVGLMPEDNVHWRHQHLHRRSPAISPRPSPFESPLEKRGTCAFPTDAGLIAVTPDKMNAGWAMSHDQPCKANSWCPYACPPGKVMAQWDPDATTYSYPQSMNGGLFCDSNGNVKKPFPDKPYCVDGVGTVKMVNNFDDIVAVCQTVLPGNEEMLIPTAVSDMVTLAVPDPSYWCKTAAHFYVNPPGYSTKDACVWGDEDTPIGNWSPYVTGANQDGTGNTFVTLGWNPIFIDSPLCKTLPDFGLRIECDGNCVGTPCSIDPTVNGLNKVTSATSSTGAGGAAFCVVTVPKGVTAKVVVFDVGHSDKSGKSPSAASSSSASPPSSSSGAPSSSSSSAPASSSTSAATTSSASVSASVTATSDTTSTTSMPSTYSPGVLFQNDTTNANGTSSNGITGSSQHPGSNSANNAPGTSQSAKGNNALSTTYSVSLASMALIGALLATL